MKNLQLSTLFHEVFTAFKETAFSLLLWLIGYPLSLIIRRNQNLTVVIIRSDNMFVDNSKYFFLYANELLKSGERIVLFTSDSNLESLITAAGAEAIRHPSLSSLFMLLRCGNVVTDFLVPNYYPLIRKARYVQIWHGAPLKHIELDLFNKRLSGRSGLTRTLLQIQKSIIGRYPLYDMVVATSQKFIQDTFQSSFKARQFVATGYPRNDILYGFPSSDSLAFRLSWINVDKKALELVEKARNEGKTVCLYAPTFRKSFSNPFDSIIDLNQLSDFAQQHQILIVLKLHPFMYGRYVFSQYPGLLAYESHADVYPLMPFCDILVTDYSSIFFDYLLLDRPILFFAHDLESYLRDDRNIYFEYDSMTPGAKCYNQTELENQLIHIISNGYNDGYAPHRKQIKAYTHDHDDALSSRRLWEYVKR